jgi:hypothetical protein
MPRQYKYSSIRKTDGSYYGAGGTPIIVPGTTISFLKVGSGDVLFWVGATSNASGMIPDVLLYVVVDGAIQLPLSADTIYTFVSDVAAPFVDLSGHTFMSGLAAGPHTAAIYISTVTGFGAGVMADASMPLNFTVGYP